MYRVGYGFFVVPLVSYGDSPIYKKGSSICSIVRHFKQRNTGNLETLQQTSIQLAASVETIWTTTPPVALLRVESCGHP